MSICTNLMCENQENRRSEGNATLPKKRTPLMRTQTRIVPMFIIAVMIVIVILVIPVIRQPRINVTIGQDRVIDVSAQTVYVPLISTIFPAQQNQVGVYTIEAVVDSATYYIYDVPIGEYTFVLSGNFRGTYTINIILVRNATTVSTFPIVATF